ncbi:MAG: GreA/GreB family elongation factor [Paracraurococcus sp.]|jgi:transcription elongation factor GreA
MTEKFPISPAGLKLLHAEMHALGTVEIPAAAAALADAKKLDAADGADYMAAKQRHDGVVASLTNLEAILKRVEVIDPGRISGLNAQFGSRVTLRNDDTEEERSFRILGDYEAKHLPDTISISAALARSVIGKGVGASVKVPGSRGDMEIIAIAQS